MFSYNEESRMLWLNGNTFEANVKFELIGILMGIAIYNQNILDLHLPIACYKKLLDIQPSLKDLHEYMPSVAQSLEYILKSEDPNLEATFYQNFTVELDMFG
jgi:HECT-domain (ubiquitin-transferase)